ncbi:DUF6247 family protein [Streptomyces sp. CA-111067]|uniref:DUF6247 family protein n=1 Tax=Streptomyces sp. CA-111067 TaxID=3240046 RepID=UPI003D98ED78
MTAESLPHDAPIAPRPDRTPDALREAIAKLAPYRLAEMEWEKNETLAMAVEQNSLAPVHMFLLRWAVVAEIERRPETARRLHRAEQVAAEAEDPELSRKAVREAGDIVRAAHRELGA